MKMIICGPDSLRDQVTKVQKVKGLEVEAYSPQEVTLVQKTMDRDQSAKLVLVYEEPASLLALGIEQNQDLSTLEKDWLVQVQPIKNLFRANRGRVLVLSNKSFNVHMSKVISDFMGSKSDIPEELLVPYEVQSSEYSFYLLIAERYLAQNNQVQTTLLELEALSDPRFVDEAEEFDVTRVVDSLKRLQQKAANPEELIRLKNQLQNNQSELKKAQEGWNSEKKNLENQIKEVQEENDEIILELHKVQEMFEEELISQKDFEDRFTQLEQESSRDKNRIRELVAYSLGLEKIIKKQLASKTWKIMAPIRIVGRFVKRIIRRKPVYRTRLPHRPWVLTELENNR